MRWRPRPASPTGCSTAKASRRAWRWPSAYSARAGLCPGQDAERVAAHLRAVGLPDGLAAAGIDASGATLVEHMRHDKKMAAGTLPFLLARGIGQTYLDKTVDLADVAAFLDAQPR